MELEFPDVSPPNLTRIEREKQGNKYIYSVGALRRYGEKRTIPSDLDNYIFIKTAESKFHISPSQLKSWGDSHEIVRKKILVDGVLLDFLHIDTIREIQEYRNSKVRERWRKNGKKKGPRNRRSDRGKKHNKRCVV